MQPNEMKLDNERKNKVIIIPYQEANSAKELLKGYDDKLDELIREARGNIDTSWSDCFVRGKEGYFWSPVDLRGIYLAIKKYFPTLECEKIIQVAGGVSPFLYALSEIHPESTDKLVGVDIDSYFRDNFEEMLPYPLINEDVRNLKRLNLKKPSLAFSYHFFDYNWLSKFRPHNMDCKENLRQNVNGIIEALSKNSVMISQPELTSTWCRRGLKKMKRRLLDERTITGFLLNYLNTKPDLEVDILMTEGLKGIEAVVLASKIK